MSQVSSWTFLLCQLRTIRILRTSGFWHQSSQDHLVSSHKTKFYMFGASDSLANKGTSGFRWVLVLYSWVSKTSVEHSSLQPESSKSSVSWAPFRPTKDWFGQVPTSHGKQHPPWWTHICITYVPLYHEDSLATLYTSYSLRWIQDYKQHLSSNHLTCSPSSVIHLLTCLTSFLRFLGHLTHIAALMHHPTLPALPALAELDPHICGVVIILMKVTIWKLSTSINVLEPIKFSALALACLNLDKSSLWSHSFELRRG